MGWKNVQSHFSCAPVMFKSLQASHKNHLSETTNECQDFLLLNSACT